MVCISPDVDADASERSTKLGMIEMALTAKTNNRIKMILLNFIIILLFWLGEVHFTTGSRLGPKYKGTKGFCVCPEMVEILKSITKKNDMQLASARSHRFGKLSPNAWAFPRNLSQLGNELGGKQQKIFLII
jgi:hypothetical protein